MRLCRRAFIALCIASLSASGAAATPQGYLEPTNATLVTGKLRVDSSEVSTVNFTVTNKTDQRLQIVAVDCTALVGDEPVETNADPVGNVGPGEKAYGSVSFFKLNGRPDAMASCRIEYIKLDR